MQAALHGGYRFSVRRLLALACNHISTYMCLSPDAICSRHCFTSPSNTRSAPNDDDSTYDSAMLARACVQYC